jgi:hypothetical protein
MGYQYLKWDTYEPSDKVFKRTNQNGKIILLVEFKKIY